MPRPAGNAARLVDSWSWSVAGNLHLQRNKVAERVAERLLAEMPHLTEWVGTEARDYVERDVAWLLEHLAQAMALTDPILFHDHITWAKSVMTARGLKRRELKRSLQAMAEVLDEEMEPASYANARALLDGAIARLDRPAEEPAGALAAPGLHVDAARTYVAALIASDRAAARRAVLAKVDAGAPVEDVLLHVLEPAQVEIGRLWQLNRITVAHEHFATGVTQDLMSELIARTATPQARGTLVAACVERELHDTGLRLVSSVLQLHGWACHYLGANTPKGAILDAVRRQQPDVLALSATAPYRTWHLAEVLAALRADPETKDVKVLVGGYPFHVSPSLADWIGADGTARNAGEAVHLAGELAGV